jgi:hypothetical protein
MYLQEIGFQGVEWIDLAQEMEKCLVVLTEGNFLSEKLPVLKKDSTRLS